MDKKTDNRQQLIPEAPAFKAAADHADVAERAWRSWSRLAVHLSTFIGEAGFCALYGRAMRLVMPQYEWLTGPQSSQSIDVLLKTLKENLASIDPITADNANTTLFDTFTNLLSGLIGVALTTRILDSAWIDEPERKNTQEHK